MTARVNAARLLAAVAPSEAIDPVAEVLAQGEPSTRAAVRSALAKAAAAAAPAKVAALIADEKRATDARVELLRAFVSRLPEVAAPAVTAIDALIGGAPFARRYLLVDAIAALARAGDAASTSRLATIITGDPEDQVRAHAAESATKVSGAGDALKRAIDDSSPRVREAALRAFTASPSAAPVDTIARRLASDEWTFVRAAAATTLASFAPDSRVDDALIGALADRAPAVRAQVIGALATRGVQRAFTCDSRARR